MAIVGDQNAGWTGQQAGTHQVPSVLDFIVDVAPMELLLLNISSRGSKPTDTYVEWWTDYLGAWPGTDVGTYVRGEGDDASPTAPDARTKLRNNTHIYGDAFSVTHTRQVVRQYGVTDAFDYEASRKGRKIARIFEQILHTSTIANDTAEGSTAAGPNTTGGTSRAMAGLIPMIEQFNLAPTTANPQIVTGELVAAERPYLTTIGSTSTAPSNLAAAIVTGQKTIWERAGFANGRLVCLCNGGVKRTISNTFAPDPTSSSTVYRRYFGNNGEMIGNVGINLVVDVIETDFGRLEVLLDRSVPPNELVGFQPEFWQIHVLRDFETIELAKMGPSRKGHIEAEMTCSLLAPNTAMRIAGITDDLVGASG